MEQKISFLFYTITLLWIISGCGTSQIATTAATSTPTSSPTETPPSIKTPARAPSPTPLPSTYIMNLGVNIDNYDPRTGKAGDIIFSTSDKKPFIEFGPGTLRDRDGNPKDNPAFEYHLDPDADVIAIADGTVVYFEFQEDTGDYEIGVLEPNKAFAVFYDHIKNITIQGEGEKVVAGDILGKPGTWNSSMGRFEIQVNTNPKQGDVLASCPFIFFHPDLIEEYKTKVANLMHDWESFTNSSSQYDEATHIYPGCLSETVIP